MFQNITEICQNKKIANNLYTNNGYIKLKCCRVLDSSQNQYLRTCWPMHLFGTVAKVNSMITEN